jgi:hypothetical protein
VWHDVMMAAHQGLEARVLPGTIPTIAEPETEVANVDVQSSEPAPQVVDPPLQEVVLQPLPRTHKKRGLFAKIFGIGDDNGSAPRQKKAWELRQEGGGN